MALSAPSRTRGGVGRSQMPWPRLMPPTRSHSRVMRRMSDWARSWRRRETRVMRYLRFEGFGRQRTGQQIAQGVEKHVVPAAQIVDADLLVGAVARIRLSRKPHPEGDGVGHPLGVGAAAGDGG